MRLILDQPTKLLIQGETNTDILRRSLTFKNRNALYELEKFKKNSWFVSKYGQEAYDEKLQELKDAVSVCLLYEDESGLWTHSGLAKFLLHHFKDSSFESRVTIPEPHPIPWKIIPEFELRFYQHAALQLLLGIKHGGVEIGTGLGKSYIILYLCKVLGLKTVIMAPTESIWSQLVSDFTKYLGEKYVGVYGGGKKRTDKLITIGIAASFTRIQPGSEAWEAFSETKVFIADESHLCPAKTLASVCLGLCAKAPYRFFFSGTQTRGDGANMLLDGITGPIVFGMTVKEGVDQGFLAKPLFRMMRVNSPSAIIPKDPKRMVQEHFLYNPIVIKKAADFANRVVKNLNHQVLILIEEIPQFTALLPYLKHEVGFAHAALNKDDKHKLPSQYHKSDPKALVERFNRKELPILVGTSCINTGTNIEPVNTLINLQGGMSIVKAKQSIGRGTRRPPGKDSFVVLDFIVRVPAAEWTDANGKIRIDMIHRHCLERKGIYEDIYGPVLVL